MQRNIYSLYILKVAKWFMLTMPILMLYYQDLGFSKEESFQLKAFYSIAIVLFEIPSGYFADVMGRKVTLLIGSILGFAGFAIYSYSTDYYFFLIAEITLGIGQSFISGSDSAMLFDTLKANNSGHHYMKYEGKVFSLGNYAEAAAGVLGGLLAEQSLRLPFYCQTGIAFIGIPAAIMLVEPQVYKKRIKPGITDILKVIHFSLIKSPNLRWNLIYSSIIGSATLTMAWVYQLLLKEIGFSEFWIGATATLVNILVGTVTIFAYRIERKLKPKTTIWLTTLLITGSYILAGFIHSYWILAVLMIFYFSRGIATPVLKDYVNKLTTSDIRATVLSIRSLMIRGYFAIIAPLFGWMSDAYSLQTSFIVLGLTFTVLTGSCIILFIRSVHSN